jgi:SAM-dependent methyltransferase
LTASHLSASHTVWADYSTAIAAAGRLRNGHRIVRADGAALPFRTDAFDLAYFADVLEHVLDPVGFLREVSRVCRRILFFIPIEAGLVTNPIYLMRRLRGKHTNYEQYGHIWRWNRVQVRRLIRAAGIQMDVHRCFQAPPHLEGMNRVGRAMENLRVRTGTFSPVLAEALFGSGALIGLGRRSASVGRGAAPPP